MPTSPDLSADRLASELARLGLPFLRADVVPGEDIVPPADLLTGLAASSEARLRLAIIPLLLWRPDYAEAALTASRRLTERPRLVLHCYYTAAVLLQQRYTIRLRALGAPSTPLPDLFSRRLRLKPAANPDDGLVALAQKQTRLTGEPLNWLGTYDHGASTFLSSLEHQIRWAS